MSEDNNLTGRYVHRTQRTMTSPELPSKKDWWQEVCDKAGEKNYWSKAEKVIDRNKGKN